MSNREWRRHLTNFMEKFHKYLLLLLVATISLSLTSCGGDDEEEAPGYISLSKRELQFPAEGGTEIITVYGGTPDYVLGSCDWASAEVHGSQITVNVSANDGGQRSVVFSAQFANASFSFTVTQEESDNPDAEIPGGDTPGGDTPGGDTPGGDTPGGDTPGGDTPGGGGTTSEKPSMPTGLRAVVNGTQVSVSWNASTGASYYRLYSVQPAPYDIQSFDNVYSTSTTMNCTIEGTWTIWVQAVNSDYEASEPSPKVTFNISSSGGGQGGGDNPGGGSDKPSKLDTPQNLEYYSDLYYVQISCDEVPLAYTYELYRSRSANSGYVRVTASGGSSAGRYILTDQNPLSGTSYYKIKVKALSYLGIGDSDYSAYIKVTR